MRYYPNIARQHPQDTKGLHGPAPRYTDDSGFIQRTIWKECPPDATPTDEVGVNL